MKIQGLKRHPSPDVYLEQYPLDASATAEIIFIAGLMNDDIIGKKIIDLGCGTGQLGLAAALFGAREVIGIDIDPVAISIANENKQTLGIESVTFLQADIRDLNEKCDSVLQNPPFGVQIRGQDVEFLKAAFKFGTVIYSLHKRGPKNRKYLKRLIADHAHTIESIHEIEIVIPHLYHFHKKEKRIVQVDLWKIVKSITT